MNKKLKKILKRTAVCTTGFVAFAGAVVGGYALTPNRSRIIDVTVKEREKTLFERFVAKLTRDVGMSEPEEGEEEVESYLSAKLTGLTSSEKFTITYKKDKDSTFEKAITVNSGEVDFRMAALDIGAIEFDLLQVNFLQLRAVPKRLIPDCRLYYIHGSQTRVIEAVVFDGLHR